MGENVGAAMSRAVAPDFTARVFARIGVDRYVVAASALGDVFVAWRAAGVSAVRVAADSSSRYVRAPADTPGDASTANGSDSSARPAPGAYQNPADCRM